MKILKIFGIVVGIHVFALILIFANPGCSSTAKPAPSIHDTAAAKPDSAPIISAAGAANAYAPTDHASTSSAITFNPDAPAAAAPASEVGVRFTPTRPGSPVAGSLVAEPVSDVTPVSSYTVKSGDNLWTIARKNNTTVAQLAAANSLPANVSLHPGQKLIIPGKNPAASAPAPAKAAASSAAKGPETAAAASSARATGDAVKHVVKPGETLGAIARKYGVRQGDIAVANNISDPAIIKPGKELIIPGWQAAGAKSGKKAAGTETKSAAPANATTRVEPVPPAPVQPAPATPPVPVIRIDESPVSPAPNL